MARQETLTVKLHISGARETLAAFRQLPKEASTSLREQSLRLATLLAGKVAGAARADTPQSALMAPTVKAVRDRIPAITAGGTSRVGRNQKPAYRILFGSEFGARTLRQYRPHVGRGSYWMFRTVEANQATIAAAWSRVADDIVRSFQLPTPGERVAEIFADVHTQFASLGLPEV
jgi:hypothetical protein